MNKLIRYSLVSLFLSLSLFCSCSSDEDGPQLSPIVGFWSYDNHEVQVNVNDQDLIEFLVQQFEISEMQAQFYKNFLIESYINNADIQSTTLQFDEDGTYTIREGTDVEKGNYELRNDNTVLVLHSEEETLELKVDELTDNRLRVIFEEEEQVDITEDGEEETIQIRIILKFIK